MFDVHLLTEHSRDFSCDIQLLMRLRIIRASVAESVVLARVIPGAGNQQRMDYLRITRSRERAGVQHLADTVEKADAYGCVTPHPTLA